MRFRKRDLVKFYIFEAEIKETEDGVVYAVYDLPHSNSFYGNIQPYYGNMQPLREGASSREYGVTLQYSYVIYCGDRVWDMIEEGYRISENADLNKGILERKAYEVKLVQKWDGYLRILVKLVREE